VNAWENFFAAQIGAAAALAGLIFVGVSVNAQRISKIPDLHPRVRQALAASIAVLLESIVLLVPGQPLMLVGIGILLVGVPLWTIMLVAQVEVWQKLPKQYHRGYFVEAGALLVATGGFGYVSYAMIRGDGSRVIWAVPGIILYYAATMFDAWLFLRISVFDNIPGGSSAQGSSTF
jgi:hypothetical protein